ncbi:MAG: hypothetical protein AAGJ18_28855 [Bacteroidota bacterium]
MQIPNLGLLLCFLFLSCATTQKKAQINSHSASSRTANPVSLNDLTGTWDISIQTRRGAKKSVLTIVEENGQLRGKTERTNFNITQSGNQLTWTSNIDSPMGTLEALHQVTVDGTTMEGTIKAQRRTLDLVGQKRL